MIEIQKYAAIPVGQDFEVVGYITEIRKYVGNSCYDNKQTDYLMCITEKSMPNSDIRGNFIVKPETIRKYETNTKASIQQGKLQF